MALIDDIQNRTWFMGQALEPLGETAEGVLFAGCRVQLPDFFVDNFLKVHGHEPGTATFVGHYAGATSMLLDAVASVAQERSDGSLLIEPIALRDAVRATSLVGFGVTGSIGFDSNGDRVPHKGDEVSLIVKRTFTNPDLEVFVNLGLVPCQVQDGKLANLSGPGAVPLR